jgi:sugar (pentulose or hexulose) kinase
LLSLGIELGSTRIKAVLIDVQGTVIATGSYTWANQLVDGYWTYDLAEVWVGIAQAYREMADQAARALGQPLTNLDSIGISAMMHGYLAFDAAGELLAPFRTWRNTTTGPAAEALTSLLDFTIPLRWSIAHLYQAVLNAEAHLPQIDFLTTLAGYVHWQLTGERVLGVGDASGMFPIDATHQWDAARLAKTQWLFDSQGAGVDLAAILPTVQDAGVIAGRLTTAGARLLDPTGALTPDIACCPPEGDAGTGMIATNAVAPRTGNISVGTSIFARIVLDHELANLHPEIDIVTTPAGDPVAMVHCNNGASEIDAWAGIFADFGARIGAAVDPGAVFGALLSAALEGEPAGGGLMAYNYLAGEMVTGLNAGRPLIVRAPDSLLTLPNLMRTLIMSSFATLSLGMRILAAEGVRVESMFAHGGVFKTKGPNERLLAAALNTAVSVGTTASEGGAWGMAVLAAYALDSRGLALADYLGQVIFAEVAVETYYPEAGDQAGYARFLEAYEKGLALQPLAVEVC